jgi:hypothetical protein
MNITMMGTQTQTFVNVVHRHVPLSLYVKLEGPSVAKLNVYFSNCNTIILDDFHGHSSPYECKVVLNI